MEIFLLFLFGQSFDHASPETLSTRASSKSVQFKFFKHVSTIGYIAQPDIKIFLIIQKKILKKMKKMRKNFEIFLLISFKKI